MYSMRDKASPGTWLSWLTVSIGGAAMVGVFALAGGVGSGQRGVSAAVAADTSSSSSSATEGGPTVIGVSTPSCVSGTLTGAIKVSDKFQGTVTVGLFAISDPAGPLVRSFTDTGMRATVTFNHALRGPFTFTTVPEGQGGFLVAVLPPSGTFAAGVQLPESRVIPSCNTVTATLTNTTTVTALTTTVVTSTFITYVTTTQQVTTSECVFDLVHAPVRAGRTPRSQISRSSFNPCAT
jgi:hypothetical protein